jgi:hypothetical protein
MVLLQSSSKPSLAKLKIHSRELSSGLVRALAAFPCLASSNGTVFIASDARSMMTLDVY